MRRWCVFAVTLCSICLLPAAASAGGIEIAGAGGQALGRGGAVIARSDDPMVLAYNPAGLAELRGKQLLVNLNIVMFDACVHPIGYYGWGAYRGGTPVELEDPDTGETEILALGQPGAIGPAEEAYYSDPLDEVCLDQAMMAIPQMVWTMRVSERLGIGVGFIFPAAQPAGRWGGKNGVIRGDDGDLRPSPVRYMQLQSNMIGVFPTIGAGVRLIDQIRLGLALQWGIVGFDLRSMTVSGGGTSPARDIVLHLHGDDMFVPSFTVSTHIVPVDALDFVVAFKWQDKVEGDAELELTTGVFDPFLTTHVNPIIDVDMVRQYMPWKLSGGIRYAQRRGPRPQGTGRDEADEVWGGVIRDPLNDELWDIELDLEYQFNSRVQSQKVVYAPDQFIEFEKNLDGTTETVSFPPEGGEVLYLQKRWQDQVSLRLGGTYNIVQSVLGVSAGAHYENRGLDVAVMGLDFWPLERVGLHGGLVVRIMKSWDLTFSYAHIFQESIVVAPPPHGDRLEGGFDKTVGTQQTRGDVLEVLEEAPVKDADAVAELDQIVALTSPGEPGWITNAGTYRSNFNVIAFGVNKHF
jgi:hypothetical protein